MKKLIGLAVLALSISAQTGFAASVAQTHQAVAQIMNGAAGNSQSAVPVQAGAAEVTLPLDSVPLNYSLTDAPLQPTLGHPRAHAPSSFMTPERGSFLARSALLGAAVAGPLVGGAISALVGTGASAGVLFLLGAFIGIFGGLAAGLLIPVAYWLVSDLVSGWDSTK